MAALDSQIALVTGGSRGIGRAIALRLARDGAAVALTYVSNPDAAAAVAAEVTALGRAARAYRCDSADAAAVDETVARAIADLGGLDVLVNNAGITRDGLLLRMAESDWDAVLDTNLKGVFLFTRAAARHMVGKRRGRIINITSVVGLTGNAGQTNYAASKAGIIGFTKSVAKELAARNITANAVAPGYITTDMTAGLTAAQTEALAKLIPLRRQGTVDDVAAAVAFLAGPESAYITGQVLAVDGGMAM